MGDNLQFVQWFPKWQSIGFRRTKPDEGLYIVYSWLLWLGFWEIRKFVKLSEISKRLKRHKKS